MLTLSVLIEALTGQPWPQATTVIPEVVIDSREAVPGALFVALPGERVDGHDFVVDAFARGAALALVQRPLEGYPLLDLRRPVQAADWAAFDLPGLLLVEDTLLALQQAARFWRQRLAHLQVVGVTGSVGKSTTKELVAQVLRTRYRVLANPGNLNNEIGLPLTVLRLLPGYQVAVLEMGFYVPGEIAFLCQIARPQVGVVTNIGSVHAERAGSREAIARGKAELVEALPPEGVAVLNHDDPWVRWMAGRTQARVLFYGLTPEADLWADEVEGLGLDGLAFRLHYGQETFHVRVPLLGRHAVYTALAAAGVGLALGLGWDAILEGLRRGHTQLRLVVVRAFNGALLIDDTYNASPQSTLAALNLLADLQGRKVAVLGDMLELGPYEREGHEKVGLRAAEVADLLVAFGPRARIIAETARRAGLPAERIMSTEDLTTVLRWLRERLTPDDVVLVKGSRGMRMDRIVAALETEEAAP